MHVLDSLHLVVVMALAVALQILFIEAGYRAGSGKSGKPNKAQMAQVRAIMGATLGLLAFMLAFSFNMAQSHFEERTRAYLEEVSAIDSAYRGAGLIAAAEGAEARDLLRRFIALRIDTVRAVRESDIAVAAEMVRESERMHDQLWAIAERSMEDEGLVTDAGIFAQAVLAMINAHDARLQTAVYNRISPVIWLTLFAMAVISMFVTGYQAGLTGTRSSLATWALAIAFAVVITLITDLDRPNMSLFQVNQDLMFELEGRLGQGG